jgi:hypothetical protein
MITSGLEGIASIVLLLVLLVTAVQVGQRLSVRMRSSGEDVSKGTSTIEGGVLGLLGLIIAFVFFNSKTRLEERLDVVLAEINALGTAYDQSKMLPEPGRNEIQGLLQSYAHAKRRLFNSHDARSQQNRDFIRARELYGRLWTDYVEICKSFDPEYCASTILPNVTRLRETTLHQLVQRQTHTSRETILLVIFLCTAGAGLCGFSLGSHRPRHIRLHKIVYLGSLMATYLTIIDLEYPRWGTVQIQTVIEPAFDELAHRMQMPT